ncbi:hypothetical protein RJT34_15322 [Clitoria ternatea]|uniref:Peptidase A1 domain-containing protein n=1 Tax=Clitoria ternatea TaxID=43366 RepID=A0AAN9PNP9_CLITE
MGILLTFCSVLLLTIPLHHSVPMLSIPLHHRLMPYDTIMAHETADIYPADDAYAMFLWIGTPVQIVFVRMDIRSPITWFQCDPCNNCYLMQRPPFKTRASNSFKELGCYSDTCLIPMMRDIFGNCSGFTCRYNMEHHESHSFGLMVTDTLYFEHSNVEVKDFIMGCGGSQEGPFRTQFSGVLGLGRGPLSLQSQLHAKAFSFCIVSLGSEKPSSLEFYDTIPEANQHGVIGNGSIMVPLGENSRYPYYYFLQFVGISINGFMLDIQSRVWGYGFNYDGGVVIDMGTVLTYLPSDAFSVFRSEIHRTDHHLTKRPKYKELEFCYKDEPFNVYPTIEFHFENGNIAGENFVSFKLSNNQTFLRVEASTVCLSFAEGKNSALTVIGSNQLQGTLLTFDLVNEILVFTYNKC